MKTSFIKVDHEKKFMDALLEKVKAAKEGASLLCAQLNIDYMGNTIDNSHSYLVSWLKKLDYNTKELYKALPLAKKAIKVILE